MSMNFGREQSLLRQRLQAKGNPAAAAEQQQRHGTSQTFLGAPDAEIAAAAGDLAAAFPAMGRAQMTAFVRTLWKSKIHELRAAGAHLLAMRASLLEPADLPFLEDLLGDEAAEAVLGRLAADVLGALVSRHKKLWKDLRRLAGSDKDGLRRAALRAARLPLAGDDEAFARFHELAEPLLAHADPLCQQALDEALQAAAPRHHAAATAFVQQFARSVVLPPPAPIAPPPPPPPPPAPAVTKPVKAAPAAPEPKAQSPQKVAATKAEAVPKKASEPPAAKKAAKPSKPAAKTTKPAAAKKAPAAKKAAGKASTSKAAAKSKHPAAKGR
ncbi:MAG: DNA alkylation repair protein [Planctomycetota bacterium]